MTGKSILNIGLIALMTALAVGCPEQSFRHGQRSYELHCAPCHMEDGSGLENLVPDLYFEYEDMHILSGAPCLIRHGIYDSSSVFQMVANKDINAIDITNIMNYIAHDLNRLDSVYTLEHTKAQLSQCP